MMNREQHKRWQRGRRAKRYFADLRRRLQSKAKRHALVRDWLIVERIFQGDSHAAIAKALGRSQSVISDRARQLGFSGGFCRCRYYFGEPLDCPTIQWIKKRTGFSARELAAESGIPKLVMAELVWPRRDHQRVKWETAEKFTAWLDKILARLLAIDFRQSFRFHVCSRPSVLFTLVPRLRENYALLLTVLERLRIFLRESPSANLERVENYLCEQARFEVARVSREDIFAPFLPWAPELVPFLDRDVERLRGSERLERVACEWLAARCHTTPSVVNNALRSRTRTVSPETLATLIRSLNMSNQPAIAPTKPQEKPQPRGPGRPPRRQEIFVQARQLHQQGESWRNCAEELVPAEFSLDPKSAAERLRRGVQHLKSQDPPKS